MKDKTGLCPVRDAINAYCSCPKTDCENHGLCCQCIVCHKQKITQSYEKRFPHCLRDLYQEGALNQVKKVQE